MALPGRGKSGGTRTLLATNRGDRWFFVFGFEKNVRSNIRADELELLQQRLLICSHALPKNSTAPLSMAH